ncbi:hypothetical protein MYA_2365 [Burkholderia sp. KJ006]|nr:hypothetical protein MYA_2365 [Burkholderia sp. KJ006]
MACARGGVVRWRVARFESLADRETLDVASDAVRGDRNRYR